MASLKMMMTRTREDRQVISIGLNVPADDGIDVGELGLDEHLHIKDDDDDDRQWHRHDRYGDDDEDTGLNRAISAGLPSTKIMFTMSFPMCRFLSTQQQKIC